MSNETPIVEVAPLTAEDLDRLYVIADSATSGIWRADREGRILNMFDYVVASFEQWTDARVVAELNPDVCMRLIELAREGLAKQPAKRVAATEKSEKTL